MRRCTSQATSLSVPDNIDLKCQAGAADDGVKGAGRETEIVTDPEIETGSVTGKGIDRETRTGSERGIETEEKIVEGVLVGKGTLAMRVGVGLGVLGGETMTGTDEVRFIESDSGPSLNICTDVCFRSWTSC